MLSRLGPQVGRKAREVGGSPPGCAAQTRGRRACPAALRARGGPCLRLGAGAEDDPTGAFLSSSLLCLNFAASQPFFWSKTLFLKVLASVTPTWRSEGRPHRPQWLIHEPCGVSGRPHTTAEDGVAHGEPRSEPGGGGGQDGPQGPGLGSRRGRPGGSGPAAQLHGPASHSTQRSPSTDQGPCHWLRRSGGSGAQNNYRGLR